MPLNFSILLLVMDYYTHMALGFPHIKQIT